jgi:hypothetical protein
MSIQTPAGRQAGGPVTAAQPVYDEDRGAGWVTFSGVILMIVGTMNVIGGIAAIDDSAFFVGDAKYILTGLHTWGWVITIIGAAQFLTALGIWARNSFARWLGVLFASANAIAQLLMMPAFPLWSLALFTLDILVVYGLIAYGGRLEQARA